MTVWTSNKIKRIFWVQYKVYSIKWTILYNHNIKLFCYEWYVHDVTWAGRVCKAQFLPIHCVWMYPIEDPLLPRLCTSSTLPNNLISFTSIWYNSIKEFELKKANIWSEHRFYFTVISRQRWLHNAINKPTKKDMFSTSVFIKIKHCNLIIIASQLYKWKINNFVATLYTYYLIKTMLNKSTKYRMKLHFLIHHQRWKSLFDLNMWN